MKLAHFPWMLMLCGPVFAVDLTTNPLIPNLPAVPGLAASTVPKKGDLNPYGVAFVPQGFPVGSPLRPGDILVSNFNDSANAQGTGTTIVSISPGGEQSLFFHGQKGLGLTTALGVLRAGVVLVGNLPSPTGSCTDPGHMGVGQGSLLVLDAKGHQVAELRDSSLLDGPWDLTVVDQGGEAIVFVSSVLNGVVTRLNLQILDDRHVSVQSATQIGSGYAHRCDPAALVVGPTGLAFDAVHDILYVASTGDNAIYSISSASSTGTLSGKGTLVYNDSTYLRGPLALVLTPNGDLVTTNGDAVNGDPAHPSEMVEFTTAAVFVTQQPVNSTAQGGAFGIALDFVPGNTRFAAVDDVLNVLDVWTIH